MAGALGMERRETMKRYSKLAKGAELGGNAGGEAEGGTKFSLEIWGQILKARKGERAGEDARGGGREPRGDLSTRTPTLTLAGMWRLHLGQQSRCSRCSGSSGGGLWSDPGCEALGQPLHFFSLVSSSVKQILGDTQGLRSFMKLLKGAQNRVWLRK